MDISKSSASALRVRLELDFGWESLLRTYPLLLKRDEA